MLFTLHPPLAAEHSDRAHLSLDNQTTFLSHENGVFNSRPCRENNRQMIYRIFRIPGSDTPWEFDPVGLYYNGSLLSWYRYAGLSSPERNDHVCTMITRQVTWILTSTARPNSSFQNNSRWGNYTGDPMRLSWGFKRARGYRLPDRTYFFSPNF